MPKTPGTPIGCEGDPTHEVVRHMDLGQYVAELRTDRELTLKQLAKKSGISHSHLGRIERGQAQPSLATIEHMATGLGVDIAEFVLTSELNARTNEQLAQALARLGIAPGEQERVLGLRLGTKSILLKALTDNSPDADE